MAWAARRVAHPDSPSKEPKAQPQSYQHVTSLRGPAMRPRPNKRTFGMLSLLLLILSTPTSTFSYQSKGNPKSQSSNQKFIIGANYEGPTDRAWAMWEPDKFDANLISQDFARARSVGITTLRI